MIKLPEKIQTYLPLFWQIFRFGIVGLTASGVHFSLVVLFVQMFGLPPLVANMVAFPLSFQCSYWGHRSWTFHDTSASHRSALPKLVMVQLINFTASETLFYIFLQLHFSYQAGLLLVLTIMPIFTFISSKRWVFR